MKKKEKKLKNKIIVFGKLYFDAKKILKKKPFANKHF
jgi:hypothetical protein